MQQHLSSPGVARTMTIEFEHEHAFFAHEDPRYLICHCGQYAVRTRTDTGQRAIRLIDPPVPIVVPAPRELVDATVTRLDDDADARSVSVRI